MARQIILSPPPKKQRLSALEKALAVLEAIADQPQAVGLPDLADRLKIARQTVHRVLVQLERTGLILRDPVRERYSIGPRQSRLALTTLCSSNRNLLVNALLQSLVDDLGESCNIGVLDGPDYVLVARIECKWPLRAHLAPGSRSPPHANSGGKMMLSQLEPEARKRLLKARPLKAVTTKTITRLADLEAELAKTRERDFAISEEEMFEGIVGVAVPIRDASGRALAALTTNGPVSRLSRKQIEARVPLLRRMADRLAKAWFQD